MAGAPRMIRRARGYAPAPIQLPAGFERAPPLLALGGELKSTFCLLKDGQAILSQHQGDLEDAATFDDYQKNLALYRRTVRPRPDSPGARPASRIPVVEAGTRERRKSRLPLHRKSSIIMPISPAASPRTDVRSTRRRSSALPSTDSASATTAPSGAANFCSGRLSRLPAPGALKPVAMPGGAQAIRAALAKSLRPSRCGDRLGRGHGPLFGARTVRPWTANRALRSTP